MVKGMLLSYGGRADDQVMPPLVLYSTVPPLPETVPTAMLPGMAIQFTQVLLIIDKAPDGGAGVVHVDGMVIPTETILLLHPLAANTLAPIINGELW